MIIATEWNEFRTPDFLKIVTALKNKVIFDGTSPGLPATMRLQSVIPGWIEALQLMREGDRWLLTIPPNLGYGVRGAGDGVIPPNQVLLFDVRTYDSVASVPVGPAPHEIALAPDGRYLYVGNTGATGPERERP